METKSYLTREEFFSKFKLGYALATKDDDVMDAYESYCLAIRILRSESIKYLRGLGLPGRIRSEYNDMLQSYAETSHRKYLFAKDPTCGICLSHIDSIKEATIDHIIPRAKGGPNAFHNKQIAHGYCNVKKADHLDFKWERSM